MLDPNNQETKKKIICPKCGEEMESQLAFNSQYCGIRAVAICKTGCKLSNQEQQKLNLEASDQIFM